MELTKPACHNRETFNVGYWVKIPSAPGERPRYRYLAGSWFKDRCASWDVIVQGEMYSPQWEGWDCKNCKWKPDENQLRYTGRKPQ